MATKADYLAEFAELGINPPESATHDGPHRNLHESRASKDELRRTLTETKRNLGTLPDTYHADVALAQQEYQERALALAAARRSGEVDEEEFDRQSRRNDELLHTMLDQAEPVEVTG